MFDNQALSVKTSLRRGVATVPTTMSRRRRHWIWLCQFLAIFFLSYNCIVWFQLREQYTLQTVVDSSIVTVAEASRDNVVVQQIRPDDESSHHQHAASEESPRHQIPATTRAVDTTTQSTINSFIQQNDDSQSPKATIAYITSITACPKNVTDRRTMFDMAAVLKHSIHLNSIRAASTTTAASRYDYVVFAFMHPNATAHCQAALEHIGFQVLVRETPVMYHEVQNEAYRRILFNPNQGCCGEKELLKLYTYTMHDYPLALHLDLDFIILKPLDVLFDVFLTPDSAVKYIPHAMWPEDRVRKQRVESMFTRDYPMSTRAGISSSQVGMQGGFLLVRPNQTAFEELVGLVKQGNYKAPHGGWYDGNVQYPGFYGAPQIQGLIGFYYGHYYPKRTVELNRCLHNNMVDNPRNAKGECRAPVGNECENCRTKNLTELYSAHFTFCMKPLKCPNNTTYTTPQRIPRADLCLALHKAWHQTRYDLETQLGISKPYKAGDASFGHCAARRQYLPIEMGW